MFHHVSPRLQVPMVNPHVPMTVKSPMILATEVTISDGTKSAEAPHETLGVMEPFLER